MEALDTCPLGPLLNRGLKSNMVAETVDMSHSLWDMYVLKKWEVTEDDVKKVSVYAVTYYFVRIIRKADLRSDTLNEEDDDRAVM